ncbi:MAG TPA: MFS transporter, partial [Pseudonocardiaceae bacterium]|nr:MFS transporter [Pseudonocardiaceae bacterium]
TGSNGLAGLAFLAWIGPRVLNPFTAVLADRLPRRPLVVVLNLVLAGWVCLALLVDGPEDIPLLYVVLLGVGLGTGLHNAAGGALLPRMVPTQRLGQSNALLRTAQEIGLLVAPVIGAAIYVRFGARAVAALDAVTFVLCAGLVAAVRVREPKAQPRLRPWRAELVAGIVHVLRTPPIRHVVLAMGGAVLAFGLFESIIFAVIEEGLHRPAAFLGAANTAKGVGSVLGGLVAMRIMRRLAPGREAWLSVLGLALLAAGCATMLIPTVPTVLAGEVILGLGIPTAIVGMFTVAQHNTPQQLLGRVSGSASMLVTTPQVVSVAIGAALIGFVDYRILLALVTAAIAVAGGYLWTRLAAGPKVTASSADLATKAG